MDKDVKDLIEWLADEKGDVANLWGMENTISEPLPKDKATLLKIFNEEQLAIIVQIVKNTVAALKFHDTEQDDSHNDLRENIEATNAKLRNHRHDTTKQYSSKPEF
jgi:hypothetical protein